jgi:hypothetical protein
MPRKSIIDQLTGGAGQCVNNKTAAGLPIDPITLETIPLNKSIQLPVNYYKDPLPPGKEYGEPIPGTDYYCFNQDTLLQSLKNNDKNPFTNIRFKIYEAESIVNQLKGPKYEIATGYGVIKSYFSHRLFSAPKPDEKSPWPTKLVELLMYGEF